MTQALGMLDARCLGRGVCRVRGDLFERVATPEIFAMNSYRTEGNTRSRNLDFFL